MSVIQHEARITALEDAVRRLEALLDAERIEVARLRSIVAAPIALAAKRKAQGTNGTHGAETPAAA